MPPSLVPAFRGTRPTPRRLHMVVTRLFSSSSAKNTFAEPLPLRILFCGSDDFSCAALSALHDLHVRNPSLVESIDVLVRPGKPSGRGLKRIAVGPLYSLAESLKLPIHQRDTFTGWELPLPGRVTNHKTGDKTIVPLALSKHPHRTHHPFNLIIAVSFGLFVPPRILSALPYGGLNVHPSLLPDLRGPAPIQWSIIAGHSHTGVTLQTLHSHFYDRGHILAQTPPLPVPENATTADLLNLLTPEAARLLVSGLENGLYKRPNDLIIEPTLPIVKAAAPSPPAASLRTAPKITKADLAIDWARQTWARDAALYGPRGAWTASDLARRWRAVGTSSRALQAAPGLWTHATSVLNPDEYRVIWEHVEAVRCPAVLRDAVLAIVQAHHPKAKAAATTIESVPSLDDDLDAQAAKPAAPADDDDDAQIAESSAENESMPLLDDNLEAHAAEPAPPPPADDDDAQLNESSAENESVPPLDDNLEAQAAEPAPPPPADYDYDDDDAQMAEFYMETPETPEPPDPPPQLPGELPSSIANVSWAVQAIGLGPQTQSYRLPLFMDEDDGSVIVPLQVPYSVTPDGRVVAAAAAAAGETADAVRVRSIKVEGQKSRPATRALQPFLETRLLVSELPRIKYALDIMAKEVDLDVDSTVDLESQTAMSSQKEAS